jgi:cysteinyl-tRNA synthetase
MSTCWLKDERWRRSLAFEALEAAHATVERLRNFVWRLQDAQGEGSGGKVAELLRKVQLGFGEAMDDDLNVSVALSALFDFVREMNGLLDAGLVSRGEAKEVDTVMHGFDGVLGVIGKVEPLDHMTVNASSGTSSDGKNLLADINALLQKREQARKAKDWKTADALRARLNKMGIVVEDTPQGVRLRLVKKS